MRLPRLFDSLHDAPAKDLHLAAGTTLTFLVRAVIYGLAAVTGIVVARALGAHDRGVYVLVTTIAFMFPALAELGVSKAGIYLVGQKKCSVQQLVSNDLALLLPVSAIWISGAIALGLVRPAFIPDDFRFAYFLIFALSGALLLLIGLAKDVLIASGSILGYNAIEFAEPLFRSVIIIAAVLLFGLGVTGVLSVWLLAVVLAGFLALYLMAKRGQLKPLLRLGLLKAQLAFGLRGHLGFILQTANYRLDVFLVAAFAGSTALGHYAVAFGIAELLWQVPLTLGAVLFPKLSALDHEANTETAAATCRRVLFLTLLGTLAALASGRFLIGVLYGGEFLPAVNAFYILAPSGLFFTIHKVLGSSLAGRGMPEVSLYAGAASLPVTIGLDLLLIPRMGIEGAAVASIAAYAVNAGVVLALFLRVTRRSVVDTLLIKRTDILSSVQMAQRLLARTTS